MKSIFTLSILFGFFLSQAQPKTHSVKLHIDSSLLYKDTIIKWMTIEQAEASQKKNPKKILVDVYTTWCRWCKVADSAVYKNREIAHYINQHFYSVKFNAEKHEPVTFKNVRYVFINDERNVHEFARYLLNGKLSYPGTAFIDEKGNLIDAKNGYMDAYFFEAILNYYGSGAYKTMKYSDFEDNFDGKIDE